MRAHRQYSLEPHGSVFFLAAGKEGPPTIELNGRSLIRYMDRIYLPDKPSLLDERAICELAELRLILGPELIDSRYTQGVLSHIYRKAAGGRNSPRILDFGCGDGNIAALVLTLPKSGRPQEVVGVDICPLAINLAHERLATTELGAAALVRTNESMPLADGYFDAAIANFVMQFPLAAQQAKDIYRVLTPGGRFVYNDYRFRKDPSHEKSVVETLQRAGFSVRRETQFFPRIGEDKLIQNIEQRIAVCVKPRNGA